MCDSSVKTTLFNSAAHILLHRTIAGGDVCGSTSKVDEAMDIFQTDHSAVNGVECYTKAVGYGPRNFEPWSSNEDDTWAGNPSPSYHTTLPRGHLNSRQIERGSLPFKAGLVVRWLELVTCLS
ncbi:hypothetical protein TNCV_2864301 [Trichonephila clavipes]|nr:hypothetical protein TNCV_2864301 [Trichonephila clavipes]